MSVYPGAVPPAGSANSNDTLAAAGHTALHNNDRDEIRALATKVGTSSSTATSGTVLRGTGAGTSAWQQVALTTDVTGALPVANGGTGGTTASDARTNLGVSTALEVLALAYPVGSIYINATNSTNPATLLGFGTWSAFGAGRVIVGFDSTQTEFDTAEETGGAKTHTLTIGEMPAHTHNISTELFTPAGSTANRGAVAAGGVTSIAAGESTGGGGAHNNLQPYITCYLWKRTA